MSCAQAHWVRSNPIFRVRQLKLHKLTMAIGYSLRMCARHVASTNPGWSNLVFRSKPIAEAEISNRLIDCVWHYSSINRTNSPTGVVPMLVPRMLLKWYFGCCGRLALNFISSVEDKHSAGASCRLQGANHRAQVNDQSALSRRVHKKGSAEMVNTRCPRDRHCILVREQNVYINVTAKSQAGLSM